MIQKTNARHGSTSIVPIRAPATGEPDHWGTWLDHKYYSLEVVQHPVRARMCGFGDKDRRPLAPAAVCKMIVRREDHTIVEEDDIDISFFLVTVDLWSEDAKQEMNLVLHPSSQERIINTYLAQPKTRRRGTSAAAGSSSKHQQSPGSSHSTPITSQYTIRPSDPQPSTLTTIIPPQTPQFNTQGYTYPQQSPPMQEQVNYQNSPPPTYNTPPETTPPTWGYTSQPTQSLPYDRASSAGFSQSLPSIHSFERTSTAVSGSSTLEPWQNEGNANVAVPAYRAWPTDSTYSTVEPAAPSANASPAYNTAPLDSPIRSSQLPRQGNSWSHTPMPAVPETPAQNRYGQDSFPVSAPPPPQFDDTVYASTPYTQHSSPHASYYPNSNYVNSPPPPPPPSTNPPNLRQSYTRTLVGPLSANACRLKDEHRKPGIFFLFQDLSVRTEGTFRLRLRLMNVGVPDAGPPRTHTDVSPVLAQAFTDPFMVYSAKRFPGVPDTTALSISFGSQGQKLPLRNRHGKSRKRRRGGESDGSDEEDGDDI